MLNIYLLIPIMTSVVNGIDSSNLNGLFSSRIQMQRMCWLTLESQGLQILPDWQEYFGHPRGLMLGKE